MRLTYCGNVHPAEDLDGWLASLERWSVPIARRQSGPFELGAWWSAPVARELAADASARARVARALDAAGVGIATLNVFPYGGFHDERVKTAVYRPDWADELRLQYTRDAAQALAALLPRGASAPLSTLPLGFGQGDLRRMARNLARAASALHDLEQRTGVHLIVALEPEPFCLLETAAQTAAFLEEWLFEPQAWPVPEDVLRRHLGVCIDLCHLFVVGEEPLAALADLARRGIAVPKIQVSSCLEVRDPQQGLEALLAFDEPRYLHQTVADNGARALDLGEVRAARARFLAARRIRTHFHVPVFWDQPGALGSTRGELERVLAGLRPPLPLLEVETYTWSVLPEFEAQAGDLVAGIARELDFARGVLARAGFGGNR
jgi:sugar phosphate isomerase/epimerase